METKLTLRIDEDLKKRVEESGRADRRSLNAQICKLIEEGLAARAQNAVNPAIA